MNTTSLNKILRYICLTGIFLVPFIPLFVANGYFFPFITGKNFAFRVIVEIIFASWFILAVTDRAYRPRKSWLLWILTAFVVIIAVADATGVYPYKSFWSNFERMEGFITLIHSFAYFLVISAVLSTEKLWHWFWNTSIGVSVIISLYGILQLAGKLQTHQGDRLDATLGNSSYLAVYLLVHIFLVLFLVASRNTTLLSWTGRQTKKAKTITAVVVIVLQSLVLFNTGTRGSILGFLAGLLVTAVLILVLGKQNKKMRRTAGIVIACVIIVVVGFLAVKNTTFVKNNKVLNRFASISLSDTTTQSRFILWKMGFEGLKERPLLGWGQENFNYVFNKYYDPRLYGSEQWFDRTHNVIFDWLIAGGILGLAGYLAFFAALIVFIWKPTKNAHNEDFSVVEKSILTGLLVAYFIHNFFVFDNLVSYTMYFGLAGYIYARRTYLATPREHSYGDNRVIAPVTLVVALFVIYFLNVPAFQANRALIRAVTINSQTNIADNLELFKKAIAYDSYGSPEAREQLFTLTEQVISAAQQNPSLSQLANQYFNLSVDESKKQIARTPKDARYYILPGSVFVAVGQYDLALPLLLEGVKLTPKKQTALFELASAYVGKGEMEKSFEIAKQAYELAPSYDAARATLVAASIYAKKENDPVAGPILKSYSEKEIANNDQLLRAFYVTGQYQKLISAWKIRISEDPKNAEPHVSLAAAYLLAKDSFSAIAELRKAIELDPTFKDQGEEYIKGIQSGQIQ